MADAENVIPLPLQPLLPVVVVVVVVAVFVLLSPPLGVASKITANAMQYQTRCQSPTQPHIAVANTPYPYR
jgi:hypothetical protein